MHSLHELVWYRPPKLFPWPALVVARRWQEVPPEIRAEVRAMSEEVPEKDTLLLLYGPTAYGSRQRYVWLRQSRGKSADFDLALEDEYAAEVAPQHRSAWRRAVQAAKQACGWTDWEWSDVPCALCHEVSNPEWMLLCDGCEGHYHMPCLIPPLTKVPPGEWYCSACRHKQHRVQRHLRQHGTDRSPSPGLSGGPPLETCEAAAGPVAAEVKEEEEAPGADLLGDDSDNSEAPRRSKRLRLRPPTPQATGGTSPSGPGPRPPPCHPGDRYVAAPHPLPPRPPGPSTPVPSAGPRYCAQRTGLAAPPQVAFILEVSHSSSTPSVTPVDTTEPPTPGPPGPGGAADAAAPAPPPLTHISLRGLVERGVLAVGDVIHLPGEPDAKASVVAVTRHRRSPRATGYRLRYTVRGQHFTTEPAAFCQAFGRAGGSAWAACHATVGGVVLTLRDLWAQPDRPPARPPTAPGRSPETGPPRAAHYNVAVLGTGLAGLACAQALCRAGLSVVVLEGRDRLGGRIHTPEVEPGVRQPLGAHVLCGRSAEEDAFQNFLTTSPSLKLRTMGKSLLAGIHAEEGSSTPLRGPPSTWLLHGQEMAAEGQRRVRDVFLRIARRMVEVAANEGLPPGVEDLPLGALWAAAKREGAPRLAADQQHALDALFQAELCPVAAPDAVSFRAMDLVGVTDSGLNCFVEDSDGCGLLAVVDLLAVGLPIHCRCVVQNIDWAGPSVRIQCSDGRSYTASHTVVTFPIAVLQAHLRSGPGACQQGAHRAGQGRLSHCRGSPGSAAGDQPIPLFTPPLPADKTQAILRLGMGQQEKALLFWPRPFWDPALAVFRHPRRADVVVWHWAAVSRQPADHGWLHLVTSPPLSCAIASASDSEASDIAFRIVREMWPDAPKPSRQHFTRWGSDPFSGGSHSYVPCGASLRDVQRYAEPVEGRLWFAGEAASLWDAPLVHGAYASGLFTAWDILAHRGQPLPARDGPAFTQYTERFLPCNAQAKKMAQKPRPGFVPLFPSAS